MSKMGIYYGLNMFGHCLFGALTAAAGFKVSEQPVLYLVVTGVVIMLQIVGYLLLDSIFRAEGRSKASSPPRSQ